MKKRTFIILLTVFLSLLFCAPASADVRIKILYGKAEISCDVAPIIVNDRTMVPARAIFEAIGAEISYEEETRTVTAIKDDKTIKLQIDSNVMLINDKTVVLDSPPFIKDDRTLVPIRACAESFDLQVEWWDEARIVKIKRGAWLETKRVDSNGIIQEKTYDERGNLLFNGSTNIAYTYDVLDNELTVSQQGGGGYYRAYDVYGNLIKSKAAHGCETTYTYDENRRVVTESVQNRMSPTPTVYSYTYDAAGNLLRKETADGFWEVWSYDAEGRLIRRENSIGEWHSTTYDENGNHIESNSSRGAWTKWEYDAQGKMLSQTDAHRTTTYFYDEKGNLMRSEDSDGSWMQYTYDEAGRKTKWEMPTFSVTYIYDEYGNLIREERNDGYYTEYTYEYFLQ